MYEISLSNNEYISHNRLRMAENGTDGNCKLQRKVFDRIILVNHLQRMHRKSSLEIANSKKNNKAMRKENFILQLGQFLS